MPAQGTPQFNASVTSYSLNLANGLNTAVISPQVSTAPGAPTCVIEGAACTANSGNHEFTITAPRFIEVVVTAGNGTKTTYTISVSLNGVAPVAPTTTVPVTTTPARATAVTTAPAPSTTPEAAVVPGVTVTDTKVYSASAPKKVASGSAITVMTPAQAKERDVVSLTPQICLAADDDLVFIKTGRCVAQVVSEKTGNVLRTLRTTVVADEVSELNVGNEIVTLAPIYFAGGSSEVDAKALKRLARLKKQVSDAGTVLLVGHTGILTGNTPENQQMGRARAIATRNALVGMGAKGPFYFTSAGALDPATKTKTIAAQAENRRVIVVLIP
jgi:outer membrane protein OmpA-like peptidoglycan-associated protein